MTARARTALSPTALAALLSTLLSVTALLSACPLGSSVLDVGKACTNDNDCSDDTECVPAQSPNASNVCMPFDDEPAASG